MFRYAMSMDNTNGDAGSNAGSTHASLNITRVRHAPAFYDARSKPHAVTSPRPGLDFHFVLSGSAPPYPIVRISITPRLNIEAVPKRYSRHACISEARARSRVARNDVTAFHALRDIARDNRGIQRVDRHRPISSL